MAFGCSSIFSSGPFSNAFIFVYLSSIFNQIHLFNPAFFCKLFQWDISLDEVFRLPCPEISNNHFRFSFFLIRALSLSLCSSFYLCLFLAGSLDCLFVHLFVCPPLTTDTRNQPVECASLPFVYAG